MPKPLNKQGFTIIEIMIVLAIAGLILLIVFLAVPSLERSARNTERKHDAEFIATSRELYDEDNGTVVEQATGVCDGNPDDDAGFTTFCGDITQGLSYYTPSDVTIIDNGYIPPTSFPTVTTNTIVTESFLTCNGSLSAPTTTNADPTDAVVLYALELANGEQENLCLPVSIWTE
jgi:prepilin-type N-terminal cleavage/methylation domain-containing protein